MKDIRRASDGRYVSYAQNGEDIVLLRTFAGQPTGTWIDVGANHPLNDSVTKNFCDQGWTGINVEPVEAFHELLVRHRPNEVNLLAAVSERSGSMTFFRNESNLDLSSFEDGVVQMYRERGDAITEVEVRVVRLDDICREHLRSDVIDFMKVDTEGHELPVIRSHDFDRYPVRVLLAESTYERLDPLVDLLRERGMDFVTFDGLNAWFVRQSEFAALQRDVARPPSPVLDWYHPYVYVEQLERAATTIGTLEADLDALRSSSIRVGDDHVPSRSIVRRIGRRIRRP